MLIAELRVVDKLNNKYGQTWLKSIYTDSFDKKVHLSYIFIRKISALIGVPSNTLDVVADNEEEAFKLMEKLIENENKMVEM